MARRKEGSEGQIALGDTLSIRFTTQISLLKTTFSPESKSPILNLCSGRVAKFLGIFSLNSLSLRVLHLQCADCLG